MATATPLTKLKKCDLIRLVRSLTKSKKERMFKHNGGRPFEIAACNINRITKEQLLSKVYRLQEERKPKAKAKTPSKPSQPKQLSQKQRKEIDEKGRPTTQDKRKTGELLLYKLQSLQLTIDKLNNKDSGFPFYYKKDDERWQAAQALKVAENSKRLAVIAASDIYLVQTFSELEEKTKEAESKYKIAEKDVKFVKSLEKPHLKPKKSIDRSKLKKPEFPLEPKKQKHDGFIHLQSIGKVPAIKYGDVKKGTVLVYNFGDKGQVISTKPKGKLSVEVVTAHLNRYTNKYENHTSSHRKTTKIGLAWESRDDAATEARYEKPKEISDYTPFKWNPNVNLVKSLANRIEIVKQKPKQKIEAMVVSDTTDGKVWTSLLLVDKGRGLQSTKSKAEHKTAKGVRQWANNVLGGNLEQTEIEIKARPKPKETAATKEIKTKIESFAQARKKLLAVSVYDFHKLADTIRGGMPPLVGAGVVSDRGKQVYDNLETLHSKAVNSCRQAQVAWKLYENSTHKNTKKALRKRGLKEQINCQEYSKKFFDELEDAKRLAKKVGINFLRLGPQIKTDSFAKNLEQEIKNLMVNKFTKTYKPPIKKRQGENTYPIRDGKMYFSNSPQVANKIAAYLVKKTKKPHFIMIGFAEPIRNATEAQRKSPNMAWKVTSMGDGFVMDPRENYGVKVYQVNTDLTVTSRDIITSENGNS
jgi:hypothetical protein